MHPVLPPLLQACPKRLRSLRHCLRVAALAAMAASSPAFAAEEPQLTQAADPEAREHIDFEANELRYLEDEDTILAIGNVVMRQAGESIRADEVSWNRGNGVIIATGTVMMIDKDGNRLFSERIELTDHFEAGSMEDMLVALRAGGRLAANGGTRNADGSITLERAVYAACAVEDSHGCPKTPSWKILAREVVYSEEQRSVSFKGARLQLFGTVSLPLPGLRLRTDNRSVTGFQIPDFQLTPSNGMEISESFFISIADNRDLTATANFYTKAPPMASLQYRALTEKGAYQITGYATSSRRIPIFGSTPTANNAFRGHIFANGRFQFNPQWSVTASIRRSTDRTFLRRYDISRDDRLRSMVEIERIDKNSYFSLAGWATQTLRVGVDQGQVPMALPVVDYRRRLADPVLSGRVELQINSLAILRDRGQDTQRAFAKAQWDMRHITAMGQVVTVTALLRGDVYHSRQNQLTSEIYQGDLGWSTRGIVIGAVDVQWPFVGNALGGTQVFTPRLQVVASPSIRNLAVPNEDARAIDLEDSNLFALNRFPGYDRIEDGLRFTYGFDWQLDRPGWRIKTTIGQSIRLSNKPTILPDGTGLSRRVSDIVGRTEIRLRDTVKLVHRFRLDKDTLDVRRNEFDAAIGNSETYAEIGYVKLNRDITGTGEDLADREEVRFAGRVAFARSLSVFGSAVVNLTSRSSDPVFGSDGFQPLRTRLGVAYQDDCIDLSLTWRRDYVTTGDAQNGNSFQVRFALKRLNFR
jgi:LPS-assembly protein